MISTSEFIFRNPQLNEMTNIIRNTQRQHETKYRINNKSKVDIEGVVEDIHKLGNKIKIVKNNNYYDRYRISRRQVASNNRYVVNRVVKLVFMIEKEINKFVINKYIKIPPPRMWRKFVFNIANNGEFLNNYCNKPSKKLHRFHRDWYRYNHKGLNLEIEN